MVKPCQAHIYPIGKRRKVDFIFLWRTIRLGLILYIQKGKIIGLLVSDTIKVGANFKTLTEVLL